MREGADYVTKKFQLIGVDSQKIYFEAREHASLQRWLDEQFGATGAGTRKNKVVEPMPEAMRIVEQA